MFSNSHKHVHAVNKEKLAKRKISHTLHFLSQKCPTCVSMLIFLVLWWMLHANLLTSFASQMLSQNTQRVTSIPSKDIQRVAKVILEQWFCKFGIPAQIHSDGGKEFLNKLLARCANYSMYNTQKQLLTTHSATHRWKKYLA